MKITSPSLSVDSTAARSPERSMAGPLVMRSGWPSSVATLIAIVALSRAGGPATPPPRAHPAGGRGARPARRLRPGAGLRPRSSALLAELAQGGPQHGGHVD